MSNNRKGQGQEEPMEERFDEHDDDDEQLEQLLQQSLARWEATIEPEVPALDTMTRLVQSHRQQLRTRLWRDLLLLWIVGGLIVSGMLLLLEQNMTGFIVVQVIVLLSAAIFGVRYAGRSEGVQPWTK